MKVIVRYVIVSDNRKDYHRGGTYGYNPTTHLPKMYLREGAAKGVIGQIQGRMLYNVDNPELDAGKLRVAVIKIELPEFKE